MFTKAISKNYAITAFPAGPGIADILAIIERFNNCFQKDFFGGVGSPRFCSPPPRNKPKYARIFSILLKSDTTTICLITPKPD